MKRLASYCNQGFKASSQNADVTVGYECQSHIVEAISNQNVVVFGGGTGLSTLLKGLRLTFYPSNDKKILNNDRNRLTAIVTVSDDGGSSGVLRKAYPILAPGDIRNCLLALSGNASILESLFNFRFNGKVGGHSLGNLILTALAELESDFTKAVERAGEMLEICGTVLPATSDLVELQAEFTDGCFIRGESRIATAKRTIRHISLVPPHIRMLPQAGLAISRADTIVIGPGSLYTSLIPALIVPGIADAIANSKATVVLVLNMMTEPGETDGYTPVDFIHAIKRHVPEIHIHYALINSTFIPLNVLEKYAVFGAEPVTGDYQQVIKYGTVPILCDLFTGQEKIHHNPIKLAKAVLDLPL